MIKVNPNISQVKLGAGIGHNSSANRKALYISEIAKCMEARRAGRLDETFTRQQLGALSSTERIIAMKHGLLDNYRAIYAEHPNMDVLPGVVTFVTLFSDNGDGCCTYSIARMAKFFSRSTEAVRLALKRAVKVGVLHRHKPNGGLYSRWPVVFRSIIDPSASHTWFVDASLPIETTTQSQLGVCQPDAAQAGQGYHPKPDGNVLPRENYLDDKDQVREVPPCTTGEVLSAWVREDGAQDLTEAASREADQSGSAEEQDAPPSWIDNVIAVYGSTFALLSTYWNSKPSALDVAGIDRAVSDSNLARHLATRAANFAPEIVELALAETLLRMEAMWQERSKASTHHAPGAGSFQGHFTKTMRTTCAEIAKQEADAIRDQQTKAEIAAVQLGTEQQIADRRVTAFDKAAEQNATTRAARGRQIKTAPRMSHQQIIDAARERGGDENGLVHLAWRLLALPNRERDGDPVLWAVDLSHAVAEYDEGVLKRACCEIVKDHSWCPAISDILAQCQHWDYQFGGQKVMAQAMRDLFVWGVHARGWQETWGPAPGQPGCRLQQDWQLAAWRGAVEHIRDKLTKAGEVEPLGAKIVEQLQRNAGGIALKIPAPIRKKYDLPAALAKPVAEVKEVASEEDQLECTPGGGQVRR